MMACWVLLVLGCSVVYSAPINQDTDFFQKDGPLANDIVPRPPLKHRFTAANPQTAWPNGVVVYKFMDTFPQNELNAINEAMREIENKAAVNGKKCITFRERKGSEKYVRIHRNPAGKGCNAQPGYPFGSEYLNIRLEQGWCAGTKKVVMHELYHSIGFYHEHNRPDRDNYIIASSDNSKGSWTNNDICLPYDYESVVHYDGFKAKDPKITCVGSHCSPSLTTLDVKRLQIKYGCIPRPKCSVSPPSKATGRIGCYEDKQSRHLPSNAFNSNAMTPAMCVNYCKKNGHRYAGVQYSSQCFCGDSYGKYAKKPDGDCSSRCTGDTTDTCGGTWRIEIYDGSAITLKTENAYKYIPTHMVDASVTTVKIQVKANNDARIALSTNIENTNANTYEIVIGGWSNKQTCIRRGKQAACVATKSQNSFLSGSAFRNFWVSWKSGNIQIGTGLTIGANVITSYKDPNPYTIKGVAVSTGFGSTGEWKFVV